MQTLIKQIRTYLKMSQTEFAERLNVAFATVNRWENGWAFPNRLAQANIYTLCKEKSVPVLEMTLAKISELSNRVSFENDRILLYHGAKTEIAGVIEPRSRRYCDFGEGFYMLTDPLQVLSRICDDEQSKFYIVSIDVKELSCLKMKIDIDWALLVAYCRGRMDEIKETPLYHKYQALLRGKDLVSGGVVNGSMFYALDEFFMNHVTEQALLNCLAALQGGEQYAAISQKGCDCIKVECEVSLSYLEKLFVKEMAEANREKGISLVREICKMYRRKGKFFDEILEEEHECIGIKNV